MSEATSARIRKLTMTTVCGKNTAWFEQLVKDKSIKLAAFFGVARGMKPGSTDKGPFVNFIGDFRAVNVQTGEEKAAAKLILPGIAEEMLAGALGGETREVRFAFEIGAAYKPENATKYEYTITPLTKPQDEDAISELRGLVAAKLPKQLADKSKGK